MLLLKVSYHMGFNLFNRHNMSPPNNNDSHQIDSRSGYDRRTGIYHCTRGAFALPPSHQPLSSTDFTFSLLRHSSDLATVGEDVEAAKFLINATTGESITYGDLIRGTRRLAVGIRERFPSLSQKDVAFILAPVSLRIPVLYMTLLSIGVVFSPANPVGSDSEISHQVQVSKPVIAFATSQTVHKLRSHSFPLGIVLIDSPEFVSMLNRSSSSSVDSVQVQVNQSDPAAILYSSGTTGRVKGVLLSHRNLISVTAMTHYQCTNSPTKYGNTLLFPLPLFHVFGMQRMIQAVSLGETLVFLERFDFEAMLNAVEKYKATGMLVSPPVIVAMTKSELTKKYDIRTMTTIGCGGAPLRKDVVDAFKKKFPYTEIVQGYGLTECSGAVSATFGPAENSRYGTVGRISETLEAKIVDPMTGEVLPPGRQGELWLRSPQVMEGYVGDENATVESIDPEGWLKTGDLCYIDSEGFLYIVDRLKELIKYKAYQVAPVELEQILQTHPEVADAAVVPFPDEDAGEVPMAFVLRHPGSSITEAQITDFVAQQVAPYKKVRRVAFINTIPKNPAGKILRRELTKLTVDGNLAKM